MALICAVSSSGSQGVTSTVLGMALCWPRPVLLVEADPTAGWAILAGRFRGLQSHSGLIDLVMAQRSGVLAEALPRVVMDVPDTTVSIPDRVPHPRAGRWVVSDLGAAARRTARDDIDG